MAGLERIVTDELVFSIADRLDAEGRKVSNRLVWDQVGGGSMTTIAAALRRWRERQELKAEQPAARPPLPEAMGEVMRDAADRLWKAAQDETRKEIDRLTQAMNERVEEASAERDGALAELQATVEELQAAQARGVAAVAAGQVAHGLRADLASASERAGMAEARAVEITRRADDMGLELARVHAATQEQAKAAAADLASVRSELDQARRELVAVSARAQAQQQQHDDIRQKAAAEAHRLAERMTKAEAERDHARLEAGTAREDAARLQGKVEAMTAQHVELMRLVAAQAALQAEAPKPAAAPASQAAAAKKRE